MIERRKKAASLRYDPERDHAPRLTAKGCGLTAEHIIELARNSGVPIKEDADLVQLLIQLDWQQHIPPHLYRAVAEVLAFVYRLNQKR
jgi:flagellar biosynthesis protein